MLAGTGKHKAAPRLTKPSSHFFVVAPLGTLFTRVPQLCPVSYTWLLQRKSWPTPWETAERSQCKGLVGVSLWHLSTVSEKATTVCICWWLISLLAMNLWNVSLEKTPCSFFPWMLSFTLELKEQNFLPRLDPWAHSQRNFFERFGSLPRDFTLCQNWSQMAWTHPACAWMSNRGVQAQKSGSIASITLEVLPDTSHLQSGEEWLRAGTPGVHHC